MGELCKHAFGNYVMEHLLEFGLPDQRRDVARALHANAAILAQDRHGSRIVEKALEVCSGEDQAAIADALLNSEELPSLAEDQFGCFVVKALLKKPSVLSCAVADALRSARSCCRYRGIVHQALKDIRAEP